MGLFSKLFGRDEEAPVREIDVDAKRKELVELEDALGALARRMRDDEFPVDNPGWQGRLKDLFAARADTQRLESKPDLTRQDILDHVVGVRPLYRGEPSPLYAPLAAENDRVVAALEALQD